MIPAPFDYFRPNSLEEAIGLLEKYGEEAKILSGGHSLLPLLKTRLIKPGVLIDISRVRELSAIKREEDSLLVGAFTTHHAVESSQEIRDACPLLAEAAMRIGDLQVRNRGTLGGSLAHADPAADYPATMIAQWAEMVATGPAGDRSIPVDAFFVGPYETALRKTEILTAVRLPIFRNRSGGAYCKVVQQASGFAVCGVSALLTMGSGGTVEQASIGVTGVSPVPYRAGRVEKELIGEKFSPELAKTAAQRVTGGIEALDDFYASAEFRNHLARVWTERALLEAASRAG